MFGQRQILILSLMMIFLLVACGGGSENPENAAPTRAINIPTYSYTEPTARPEVATAAAKVTISVSEATAEAIALDPTVVERGKGRYEALECGTCHGVNGEGTDEGGSLLTYSDSEDDFVTFMRSGGTLGTSHQFSSNRLSASGATNLYQYLRSLQQ